MALVDDVFLKAWVRGRFGRLACEHEDNAQKAWTRLVTETASFSGKKKQDIEYLLKHMRENGEL